jgi:transposase
MMGQQANLQSRLFYAFNLEQHVSEDHLLRGIDAVLDLRDLRVHLADYYSHTGRPSVDPELMIRMLVIGYCFGIRSERRLCEEVHLNLAYRWFCRLGLEDSVPDHSTFSKNRHGRFRESAALRHLFESVLRRCMAEGLVRGEGFAVDASIVKADAQRQRTVYGHVAINWGDPKEATRPVREYLEALDEINTPAAPPKKISLTDPAATWTAARGGPAFFAWSTNYLVDVEAGIIVDVEASAANRTAELDVTRMMIDRTEEIFGMKPSRLIGDTNYGTAAMLGWLVDEKKIAPYAPVWDRSQREDGAFAVSRFSFDAENNLYICPAGKLLKPSWRTKKKNPFRYRASLHDCQPCPVKDQCTPTMKIRKIDRSPYEAARNVARAITKTEGYQQSRNERKKVEMLFAHLKRILKLDKLRLRGRNGAQDEFLLAATAQNLRRLAKRLLPATPKGNLAPA